MKKYILMIFGLSSVSVQAQNNAIFNGGMADGWNLSAYQQVVVNIFTGGNGDGWNYNNFSQPGSAIFNGGNNDGWHVEGYAQLGNDIFSGGIGDGWASVYRPLGPLPVTWMYFTATREASSALLQWQTATEQHSSHFDVERKGMTGTFEPIGSVRAAGNSNTPASYSFVDATPLKGMNFYRIKQVDTDGRFSYTSIRILHFETNSRNQLFVYPVPANNKLMVALPEIFDNENVIFSVLAADGRLLIKQQLKIQGGGQLLELNITTLPEGVYHLKVSTHQKNASVSFIKN